MNTQINTRNVILDILSEVFDNHKYSNLVLSAALTKYQFLTKEERSFITVVSMGTVERAISIDFILNKFSKTPTNKMKPVIRNILRMGVYQIVYMDTEDYAACNEAVKLATKRGFRTLSGYVNGVLRNIARNKNLISFDDMSAEFSTPKWIVDKFISQYGENTARQILDAQYTKRNLSVHCNRKLCRAKELIEEFQKAGVRATASKDLPDAVWVEELDYLTKIPAYSDGMFWVQDQSSMLVGYIAEAPEQGLVIDICAAPGGKSMAIASNMINGRVISADISERKVMMIEDNARRCKLTNIEPEISDATIHRKDWEGMADVVVADVPCSGLGILAKKPDIKYNVTEESLEELIGLQRQILTNAVAYIKTGGTLIFSTCTLNNAENIENVKWLCDNFELELVDFSEQVPDSIYNNTSQKGYLEILPGLNPDYDGFFIAKFIRK